MTQLRIDSRTRRPTLPKLEIESKAAPNAVVALPWFFWVRKGSLAVLDQGLISGSHFLISILLARWLLPEAYGVYALAFSFFLLLSGVHSSLILEPMSVFGPSTYRQSLRCYLGVLLRFHALLSLLMMAAFGAAALITYALGPAHGLERVLAGLVFAAPAMLLFWLARRALYLELQAGAAAAGALLYAVLTLAGLFVAYRQQWLSPTTAFLLMGICGLAISSLMLLSLRPVFGLPSAKATLKPVWQQHWTYGRWALVSTVVAWVPINISLILTSVLLGTADTGALKALMNLFLPIAHTVGALSLLLLPYLSGRVETHGRASASSSVLSISLIFGGGGIVYWLAVTLFREPVFRLLYGGKFSEVVHLVPWIVAAAVFWTTAHGPGIGLRALQSPRSVFLAYLWAAVVSIVVGIPLIRALGLHGAVLSFFLAALTALVAVSFIYVRKASGHRH